MKVQDLSIDICTYKVEVFIYESKKKFRTNVHRDNIYGSNLKARFLLKSPVLDIKQNGF